MNFHNEKAYNTPYADAPVAISSSVSSLRSLRLEDNARKRPFISQITHQPIRPAVIDSKDNYFFNLRAKQNKYFIHTYKNNY